MGWLEAIAVLALVTGLALVFCVWRLWGLIQSRVLPPVETMGNLWDQLRERQERTENQLTKVRDAQGYQEQRLNDGAQRLEGLQEELRHNVETLRKRIEKEVREAKGELAASQADLLRRIASSIDETFLTSRLTLRQETERLTIAYRALLQGTDDAIARLDEETAQAAQMREGLGAQFAKARAELLAGWEAACEGPAALDSTEEARPEDPSEELRWSVERLRRQEQTRESLEVGRKVLAKWFQDWLSLWQEMEALALATVEGGAERETGATMIDQIIVHWQYQTELRLLQPAAGERINPDEMREVGEAGVASDDGVGRVVALRRRGYAWGGRVLEPAAVVVGVKPASGVGADA